MGASPRPSMEEGAREEVGREAGARSYEASLLIVRIQLLFWMRRELQEALNREVR